MSKQMTIEEDYLLFYNLGRKMFHTRYFYQCFVHDTGVDMT